MTESPETQSLQVENALLRGSLFLTARALRNYVDARHTKLDGEQLQLTVPTSYREKATAAIERANKMLKDEGPGR